MRADRASAICQQVGQGMGWDGGSRAVPCLDRYGAAPATKQHYKREQERHDVAAQHQ